MSIYTERTLPPVEFVGAGATSTGGIAATNAKSQEVLHLPQLGSGPSSPPRCARSPLGKSTVANQTSPSGKHTFHASPVRRTMSVFAQTPPSRSPRTPRKLNMVQADTSPFLTKDSVASNEIILQRQCTDLYTSLNTITADYSHIEEELSRKNMRVEELTQKMIQQDKLLRSMEDERQQATDLHKRELQYYQESVEELSRQNIRVTQQLETERLSAEALTHDQEQRYLKLCKSFKALQSNYELERNSKALLIDQIEYLTKERDILLQKADQHFSATDSHLDMIAENDFVLQNSDDERLQVTSDLELDAHAHSHPHLQSQSDSDSDSYSEGSVHETHLLSSYAELTIPDQELDASSPVKYQEKDALDASPTFQFPVSNLLENTPKLPKPDDEPMLFSPPSSQESATSSKRSSLATQYKFNSSLDDDFVLSPLKLTTHANSSYFDADSSNVSTSAKPNSTVKRRYSGVRANHSRYNSHDIIPIQVEFESPKGEITSSSAPDKDTISQKLSSVAKADGNAIQELDIAFMKLNGYTNFSKRDSFMTSSSKRSSFLSDANISNGDVTKQEITKLKFELQSLKLHNEKLLSYIGFELQKQKKNIKKLSSKQNLRPKKMSHNQNYEYSDAKLIEKSREMLIHKTRILRSVSINPVLSTKCGGSRNNTVFSPLVGLGVPHKNLTEDEDDFVFKSHFMNSLNTDENSPLLSHNRFNRLGSSNNNYEFCEHNHTIKKYKSQTFGPPGHTKIFDLSSDDESCISIDEDEEFEIIDEAYATTHESSGGWESSSGESTVSEIDYDKLNCFNQMRYLILGKEHLQKKRHVEPIVDENLNYKFLTIVIGIVIVGIKLNSHSHQHLTSG